MTQTWHDLLFAHWPLAPRVLEGRLPAGLELDIFDDRAWLGVVPFRMTNVAPRGLPAVPGTSAFPELNVRTYVRANGKPGVYFFSLDASNLLAVAGARALFHLPYYWASMCVSRVRDAVHYESRRRTRGAPADFRAAYHPTGPLFEAVPGGLEYFLTERYRLYCATRRGAVAHVDIHHRPWSLCTACADIAVNTMAWASGVPASGPPPLLHVAARQDVVAWPLRRSAH
jgi:uncharacterized protein YqjF (DUF2071 family)